MSTDEVGPKVLAYRDLDLSPGSIAKKALMDRLDQESQNSALTITGDGEDGACAQGLTSAMLGWMQSHVIPKRSSAINEAEAIAKQITVGKGALGVLEPVEVDKQKRERAQRRSQVMAEFRNRNAQFVKDFEEVENEHGAMKFDEGGRDAKVPNRILEWGILLPLVMIPEAMLNYESFSRAPIIQTGFQALGVTIIVGIGIAIAAHMVGRYVRQFNYFMRPDDEYQNRAGWPLWSIGSLLLLVALGVVWYARYYYLLPQIEEAIILGQSPPNVYAQAASMLLGNIVVFVIGAALTFLLHDPNPEYSDKARKLNELKAKRKRIEKAEINNKLSAIEQAFKEKVEMARKKASQMSNMPQYASVRAAIGMIESKDAEVMGLLSEYKDALASRLSSDFMFEQHYSHGDRSHPGQLVAKSDFTTMPSKLLWS